MKNKIVSLILILFISHFTFYIFDSSIAYAIEVGGHLIEDTTWSPENNPYLVTEILYVDSDVTLTILPGTVVKIFAAPLTSYYDSNENFWLYNGDSVAKMIWVNGKILAEGTAQDSIVFDRIQVDINYNWGSIYMTENAELSIFKHCKIENANGIWVAVSVPTKGLCFTNGKGIISNCSFINNAVSVFSSSYEKELVIIDNDFIIDDEVNPFYPIYNYGRRFIVTGLYGEDDPSQKTLVSNNNFYGIESYICINAEYLIFNNNMISNCSVIRGIGHFFENVFLNCDIGITGGDVGDSIYIKKNHFIGGHEGIAIDDAYVEISNNYFEGCDLDTGFNTFGRIFNNKIDEGNVFIGVNMNYYNNILTNYNGASCALAGYKVPNLGNIIINNETAFYDNSDTLHTNSIILQNDELFWSPIQYGADTFRNCIIDFELEYPLIDGGGNIWVDSLQAQQIFEDISNGDFHLIEGSLAIDAGFDTLGYYYPFDMDFNHRVWDGDNNGSAIIDIGPYEFGSPAFGGIEGYTYNPSTNDLVDYVLIKINNQSGEFTFSDSVGNFQYKLPPGNYNVYAERVFYEDVIEFQVEVIDGQFTQLAIPMFETVDAVEQTIPNSSPLIANLRNYPNPFNPTTTIAFDLASESKVSIAVYNVKGQKVKQLVNDQLSVGQHSIEWNGKDNNNKAIASGIYFYKISASNQESVKRMLLLK